MERIGMLFVIKALDEKTGRREQESKKPMILYGSVTLFTITLFAMMFSCMAQRIVMPEPEANNADSACIICHLTKESAASGHTFADVIDPSTIYLDCHHYSENQEGVENAKFKYLHSAKRSGELTSFICAGFSSKNKDLVTSSRTTYLGTIY